MENQRESNRANMAEYILVLMNCTASENEKDAARLEIIELLREGL